MYLTERKELPYRFVFSKDELDAIYQCNEEHGFAIVKDFLSGHQVEELKNEILRVLEERVNTANALSYTHSSFIEDSPVLSRYIADESYMRIARRLYNNVPVTLNRSAAIYKKPGAGPMMWHTDWGPLEHPYKANNVLNNTGAASMWFYLNGIHPDHAGLAIIPGSHRADYEGPEGFEFTDRRQSFYRRGTTPEPYTDMDFPECFPLYTSPTDLIIFAERTYHGVFPHNGREPRLTCGMSFRPSSYKFLQIWPKTKSAEQFILSAPTEIRSIVEDYSGINQTWVSQL